MQIYSAQVTKIHSLYQKQNVHRISKCFGIYLVDMATLQNPAQQIYEMLGYYVESTAIKLTVVLQEHSPRELILFLLTPQGRLVQQLKTMPEHWIQGLHEASTQGIEAT